MKLNRETTFSAARSNVRQAPWEFRLPGAPLLQKKAAASNKKHRILSYAR